MIELSDLVAAALLRGNQRRYLRIESWYDDRIVDEDIPAENAREEVDRGSNVPERVTFSVPRYSRGTDYAPTDIDSPLAANGQLIRVTVGIGTSPEQTEWLQRGWYVITNSEPSGDAIQVEAAGLLWKIQEARLINPLQPSGTFKSTIRNLVEPALTVEFDSALTDRAVPASVNYDDDRLGALNTTLAAWPAVAEVTPDGYLYITSASDPTEVSLALSTAAGGTIIEKRTTSTREGVYNAVVAQGTASDGGLLRGVAYDLTGPKRSGGPFNELPVPLFLDSPLITTQAQANAAAASRLVTLKRQTGVFYDVRMVPHPALLAGDLVTLDGMSGVIEGLNLPLTAAGGEMTLKVREVES